MAEQFDVVAALDEHRKAGEAIQGAVKKRVAEIRLEIGVLIKEADKLGTKLTLGDSNGDAPKLHTERAASTCSFCQEKGHRINSCPKRKANHLKDA